MAYTYKYGKKSMGQKIKTLCARGTLVAAFAAAAAGYNCYGTKADITATVVSVSGNTVLTNQGVFTNNPTIAYFKGEKETAEVASLLKPGSTVTLSIYGVVPKIGSISLEDFGVHTRNIVRAVPASAAAPAPQTPASAPSAKTGSNDGAVAAGCEDSSNMDALKKKLPTFARDFAAMEQLPLTGKPVYDMMKNPASQMRSCLIATPEGVASNGAYSKHYLRLPGNTGTATLFHESFHANQDVTSGEDIYRLLTQKDFLIGNLLLEATAVAYELAAEKEAANHSLQFTKKEGNIVSASDNEKTKAVFNEAYEKDKSKGEAAALSAGGKAVVRFLLGGGDSSWAQTYAGLASQNMNNNLHAFENGRDQNAGYNETRDATYKKLGTLPTGINFIPDELLGRDAHQFIEQYFGQMGFSFKTSQLSPPAAGRNTPKTMLG